MTIVELIKQQSPVPVPISVATHMVGMKKAIWDGERLFLSPAMMKILEDDVQRMGEHIQVVVILKPTPLHYFNLPIFPL